MGTVPGMTSTAETGGSQKTVRVAVAVPLDRSFDYNRHGLGPLPRGSIVSVPFGPRQLNGVVLGPGDGTVPATTLKPVTAVAPLPPLPPNFVDFLERVASWTMAPIGGVVKMALSGGKKKVTSRWPTSSHKAPHNNSDDMPGNR